MLNQELGLGDEESETMLRDAISDQRVSFSDEAIVSTISSIEGSLGRLHQQLSELKRLIVH